MLIFLLSIIQGYPQSMRLKTTEKLFKYDEPKFKLSLLSWIWSIYGLFNDLKNKIKSLRLQVIMNLRKPQTTQTARTLYLDRLGRPIVSRHAMLHFHKNFNIKHKNLEFSLFLKVLYFVSIGSLNIPENKYPLLWFAPRKQYSKEDNRTLRKETEL